MEGASWVRRSLPALLLLAGLILMMGLIFARREDPDNPPVRQPIGASALSHGGPPSQVQGSNASKARLAGPDEAQDRDSM